MANNIILEYVYWVLEYIGGGIYTLVYPIF